MIADRCGQGGHRPAHLPRDEILACCGVATGSTLSKANFKGLAIAAGWHTAIAVVLWPSASRVHANTISYILVESDCVFMIRLSEEPMAIEGWVGILEVAAHLQVTKESVYRWIDTKGLPAHRVGRLLRFRLSEVDAWVLESAGDDLRGRSSAKSDTPAGTSGGNG